MTFTRIFRRFQGQRTLARDFFLSGMILMAVGLPLSRFLMSLASFFMIVGWSLEGGFGVKLRSFWQNKPALALSSLFLLHLIGLLYTTDFSYAAKDLRIKLPILIYPLLFATMPVQSPIRIAVVLRLFTAAVIAATSLGALAYQDVLPGQAVPEPSLFVSHIRLSLMACLALFISVYSWRKAELKGRILWSGSALWLMLYLVWMGALVSWLVLFGAAVVLVILPWYRSGSAIVRYGTLVLFLILSGIGTIMVSQWVKDYYTVREVALNDRDNLQKHSMNGEPYSHDPGRDRLENGYYVWLYIAEEELQRAWERRSDIPFTGKDEKGQELRRTLIRYMTSKGLKKDSVGMAQLTDGDIRNIEQGVANVNYLQKSGLRERLEKILFELEVYAEGGNPSGNSVSQRLEYLRVASMIICDHFWTGVGTGDVNRAFHQRYEAIDSPLEQEYRRRAHNQYVTMLLTFGPFGLLWFLFALFYPVIRMKGYKDARFLLFFVTVLISFLTEDTLETQTGQSFFIFFQCLFLFTQREQR